jgi:hypothetical protein
MMAWNCCKVHRKLDGTEVGSINMLLSLLAYHLKRRWANKPHQWYIPDWEPICTYPGCRHKRCHICELPIIEDCPMTDDGVLGLESIPEGDKELAEEGSDAAMKDVSSG